MQFILRIEHLENWMIFYSCLLKNVKRESMAFSRANERFFLNFLLPVYGKKSIDLNEIFETDYFSIITHFEVTWIYKSDF